MEVKSNLIEDSELRKEFSVVLPAKLVNTKVSEEVEKQQKTYKLDGFRVGKVPIDVIKQKHGDTLLYNAVDELVKAIVGDMIEEKKYELISEPHVDLKVMENNKDVEFNVVFELFPNVPKIDLKKIKLSKYKIMVEEDEINEAMDKVLEYHKNWVIRDDVAEKGDLVKINFVGKIDGKEFDGGKAEDYQLELGSHSFIDTFEEQLVGKRKNDEVLVKVTFPTNYHRSSLAGKLATFDVKILEVQRNEKIELSDEFVKSNLGIDNIGKFKEVVSLELNKSHDDMAKTKIKLDALDELAKVADFDLPKGIVEKRFEELKVSVQKENLRAGKKDEIDEVKLKEEAQKTTKIGIILSQIGKDNDISINENDITRKIMEKASSVPGYEKAFIDFYRKNKNALESLKGELLEEKIVEYVIENVDVNEVLIKIKEFEKLS
jgi:trigger factor